MALRKCRECGGEVSTQARACPKCGAIRQTSVNWAFILVMGVLLAAVGVMVTQQMIADILSGAAR